MRNKGEATSDDLPSFIGNWKLVKAFATEQVQRLLDGYIRVHGEWSFQIQAVHLQPPPPERSNGDEGQIEMRVKWR